MTAQQMIQDLVSKGLSKAEIARGVKVHWQTVNHWHFGRFAPDKSKLPALRRFYSRKMRAA